MFKTLDISFNKKCYEGICKLAKKWGISKGMVLRNAIALIDYLSKKKEEGYKIVIINKEKGIQHEIIFP